MTDPKDLSLTREEQEEEFYDLQDLYHPQSKYTPEQKMSLVQSYITTGNMEMAAAQAGIPEVYGWQFRKRAAWWEDAVFKVRKEKNDELDAQFTRIIEKASSEVMDRLDNGDYVLQRDGTMKRVPLKGKELAVVAAVTYDKRGLLRGDPSTISAKKADPLKSIEKNLKEFTKFLDSKDVTKESEEVKEG